MIYPLILCGGVGKRLWPLSTEEFPKQFLSLDGKKSLLEGTIERFLDKKLYKDPVFVSNVNFKELLKKQTKKGDFIFEPCLKNTAPALITSVLKIHSDDKNATVLVLPSDHTIGKNNAFQRLIQDAKKIAERDNKIVLFGVVPNYPETGYGYIERAIDTSNVKSFKEKPDEKTAKEYIKNGYLWNSGMFLFKAEIFLNEVRKHTPELFEICENSFKKGEKKDNDFYIDKSFFEKCSSVAIDIALMEKTKEAVVLPADIDWSDVGTWQSVWKSLKKDKNGILKTEKAKVLETKNCYINTTIPVSVLGLENVAILEKNGQLLVVNMDMSSEIKKII